MDDWNDDPKHCPFCAGVNVVDMDIQWASVSSEDPDNSATLNEYQCRDCENRSFFV